MARSKRIWGRRSWLTIGCLGELLLAHEVSWAQDTQAYAITGAPLGEVEVCSDATMKSCVTIDGTKLIGLSAVGDSGNLRIVFEDKPVWVVPVFVETTPPFNKSFGRKESQSLGPAPAAGRGFGSRSEPGEPKEGKP